MTKFKFKVPQHTLAKYLRDKKGNPIGLVVGIKANEKVAIGWSLLRKTDEFNKATAWAAAVGRANKGTNAQLPYALKPIVKEIKDRATRYFRVPETDILGA
jgi:uncharacterized protein YccT (UPF0319 family)